MKNFIITSTCVYKIQAINREEAERIYQEEENNKMLDQSIIIDEE